MTRRSSAYAGSTSTAKRRFAARAGKIEDDGYEDQSLAYQQTLQLVLGAQRDALLRMRSDGELSNEAMNRIPRARPRGVAARDLSRRLALTARSE